MPVTLRIDQIGRTFYQYGDTGKPYYFTTVIGAKKAYNKATKQGRAISISKARSHGYVIPEKKL